MYALKGYKAYFIWIKFSILFYVYDYLSKGDGSLKYSGYDVLEYLFSYACLSP